MQILLIEDEPSIRTALTRALERDGHAVRSADSLAQARERLADAPPIECVVSDLKLPDGDGLSLVGTLGVPFVMVSGYATYDDAVRALRQGCVDFFTKPVAIKDVREAIARVRPARFAPAVPTWHDPEGALAAVRELVARLPGPLARLAATELVQAVPAGRLLTVVDEAGVRLWLDAPGGGGLGADRQRWLEVHGMRVQNGPLAIVVSIDNELASAYDDQSELLWHEELVLGRPVQASAWRTAGSWLLSAVRGGAGPFAGLDAVLRQRLEACGVSVSTAPGSLAQPGVGGAERAVLLDDEDLGAPVA